MKILVVGGLASSLLNFRGPLLRAFMDCGCEVHAAAHGKNTEVEEGLASFGVLYHAIAISRAGVNPLADAYTLFDLIGLIRRIKPDVLLAYTIKPVVYGGLAARFCGLREVYSMIEGLGRAFMPRESWVHGLTSLIARALYRVGLPCSKRVFFLNPDDMHQFLEERFIHPGQAVLLDGIGIDLEVFPAQPLKLKERVEFMLIARLLHDRGVMEYLDAGRRLRANGLKAECDLVGDFDPNPASLKADDLEPFTRAGNVQYHGQKDDVRPFLAECDVYVLPSFYREGTPRTVLEAMSTGRAIITTDAPGCRETVRPMREEQRAEIGSVLAGGHYDECGWLRLGAMMVGANGILIPVRNVEALVQAMRVFVEHPELIPLMGRESRRYGEERYEVGRVKAVIRRELGLLRPLSGRNKREGYGE